MRGGKRAGSGRKPVKIDVVELEKLCALQCTDEELAAWFGVSARTLERRRRQAAVAEVMERGKARGRLSLRRHLFSLAGKGNVAAAIFLAKNILGYRDAVRNEHSGPDGGPIAIEAPPDFSRLSDEEFQQLQTFLEKTQARKS
jgi:hypothetical protein